MLTGDLNVAVVEWIVQYRIKDPRKFLFHVRDVPETFRYMSEAAMRQVVGDHSVDEVLTIGREAIALQAKEELQRLCDLYGIGIEVQQLVLQDVNPPDPVKPALQRGQPGHPGEGARHQRRLGRLQQGGPAGQGRGRAGRPRRRRLRARARQQRARATPAASTRSTRSTARRRRSPAGASTSRRWRTLLPKAGPQADRRRQGPQGVLPLLAARRRGEGGEAVKPPASSIAAAVVALVLLLGSVYTVSETEQVDPHPVRQAGGRRGHRRPGLHLKLPFVQNVHRFDKRWLEFDGDAERDPDQGQEVHLGRHLRALAHRRPAALLPGGARRARRAEPARRHRRRRDAQRDRLLRPDRGGALDQPRRSRSRRTWRASARPRPWRRSTDRPRARSRRSSWRRRPKITPEFGIELVDVRFKRINYVDERSAEGVRAHDLRAQAHRRAQPLRGPGPRGRDPRAEGARRAGRVAPVGYKTAQEIKGAGRRQGRGHLRARLRTRPRALPVPEVAWRR